MESRAGLVTVPLFGSPTAYGRPSIILFNKCYVPDTIKNCCIQYAKDGCPILLAWWLFRAGMHFILFFYYSCKFI